MVLAETKRDSSFPIHQFRLDGFKQPYRLDVTSNSGGIFVFVNDQIPSKEIKSVSIPSDIQAIPIELNLRKCKWLFLPIYKPPSQNEVYFIDQLEKISDSLASSINNCLILGDFNMEVTSNKLSSFIENNGLYSLIKSPTCFKSPTNPRCIDLMLTNMKHSFFASQSFETGFSDYHHLIYTVLKTQFTKLQPKRIRFRDYKKFAESQFLSDLTGKIVATNPEDLTQFENFFLETLNKHAPQRTVRVRGNNKPHVTKELRKAMMLRTRLKKIANKSGSEYDIKRYRVQRNLVVKMNKDAKRTYYSKVNPTEAGKEKNFWKTFRPLFSSTYTATGKIILVGKEAILSDDKDVAECFNSYFANVVETLNIPPEVIEEYEKSPDPVVDAINKYASHPSIKKIRVMHGTREKFEFSNVDPTQVFSEIYRLKNQRKQVVAFLLICLG